MTLGLRRPRWSGKASQDTVLRDTCEKLFTAVRNLREIRECTEWAVRVVERMPESDAKAELGAILEQRYAVISGCQKCGYPLFSKLETLCRLHAEPPMAEGRTGNDT